MSTTKHLPSLHKLLLRNLSTATIVVIILGASLTLAALFTAKNYTSQNLLLTAQSLRYASEAAILFNDNMAAKEAIGLLQFNKDVETVSIFNKHHQIMAEWRNQTSSSAYQRVERFISRSLLLQKSIKLPVKHDKQTIGWVEISTNGHTPYLYLLQSLMVSLFCVFISGLFALYKSRQIMKTIVRPLEDFAKVSRDISRNRSFKLRVGNAKIAELNSLSEDFNALLTELESWNDKQQSLHSYLEHQATHDSLTGLPNRMYFLAALQNTELVNITLNKFAAILFIDANSFKEINDTYGHASGDIVLIHIANRIKSAIRPHDTVARLGGDEFAILLPAIRHRVQAEEIAHRIQESIGHAVFLNADTVVYPRVSIGIAVANSGISSPQQLLEEADAAMYFEKRKHKQP